MAKPTMDDVARRAGVSRALVSLVMRDSDKVSERSRAAVREAADALGYRPNLSARHLASKKTRTLGLVINDLHDNASADVADGVKAAADAAGYRLLMNSAFLDDACERAALESLIDLNVDGVIVTGTHAEVAAIERCARTVPIVVASRAMRSHSFDSVKSNDRTGAELVVDHLVALGHSEIVLINGGRSVGAGYTATMKRHRLAPYVLPGKCSEESAVTTTNRMLHDGRPVTAVFAGNDMCALGVLDALREAGRRVPEDISLVGYDNTSVGALHLIGLTTVDQRRDDVGRIAVELLIERIEGGRVDARHVTTRPKLVTRRTTAPLQTV